MTPWATGIRQHGRGCSGPAVLPLILPIGELVIHHCIAAWAGAATDQDQAAGTKRRHQWQSTLPPLVGILLLGPKPESHFFVIVCAIFKERPEENNKARDFETLLSSRNHVVRQIVETV